MAIFHIFSPTSMGSHVCFPKSCKLVWGSLRSLQRTAPTRNFIEIYIYIYIYNPILLFIFPKKHMWLIRVSWFGEANLFLKKTQPNLKPLFVPGPNEKTHQKQNPQLTGAWIFSGLVASGWDFPQRRSLRHLVISQVVLHGTARFYLHI